MVTATAKMTMIMTKTYDKDSNWEVDDIDGNYVDDKNEDEDDDDNNVDGE